MKNYSRNYNHVDIKWETGNQSSLGNQGIFWYTVPSWTPEFHTLPWSWPIKDTVSWIIIPTRGFTAGRDGMWWNTASSKPGEIHNSPCGVLPGAVTALWWAIRNPITMEEVNYVTTRINMGLDTPNAN